MSRKKKQKITPGVESVLEEARIPIEQMQPEKRTSPVITVPLAIVGIAAVIFGLVRLIRWAWYF